MDKTKELVQAAKQIKEWLTNEDYVPCSDTIDAMWTIVHETLDDEKKNQGRTLR